MIQNQHGNDDLLNNIDVTLGGVTQLCQKLHTPLLFVIADGECADLIVGRYGSHNLNVKRICRRCDVKSDQLSNPRAKYKLLKQRYINILVARQNKLHLKEISQHGNYNAFMDVFFGILGIGIVDSLPNDLMHMLRQGIVTYCLNIFYDVIKNPLKTQLDQIVREFTKNNRQSILKNYPRTNPKCGVTNVSNMTGDERMGVVFILTMMILNEEIWMQLEESNLCPSSRKKGKKANNKNNKGNSSAKDPEYTTAGFTVVFEMLLCFMQWSTSPYAISSTNADDLQAQEEDLTDKMIVMLQQLKKNVPRLVKQEWNIQKFHSLVHLALDIVAFGGTRNFDASRPENFHQPFCKAPARDCQMTHKDWTLMVAEKVKESYAINTFSSIMEDEEDNEETVPSYDSIKKRSTKFSISLDPTTMCVETTWKTRTNVRKMKLNNDLLNFTVQCYGIEETLKPRICFTECLVQCHDETYNETHTTVRCHPNYQSKGPWNDWGMIRHGRKIVPAKFHFFVDNRTEEPEAVVELGQTEYKTKGSVLTSSWSFPLPNHAFGGCRYHRIKISSYLRPCLVFEKKTTEQILVVLPYEEWHTAF